MFFILSKILSFAISPAFWVFTLLLTSLFWRRYSKRFLITAIVVFYVFSNEFLYAEFMRAWEVKPTKKEKLIKRFDAGVVLGGYANYDVAYDMVGFHESTDRLMEAVRLYKAEKIDHIMLVGGVGTLTDTTYKESMFIRDFLISIGIPQESIIIDSLSRNTHENALESTKLLNQRFPNGNFLLITSGYHMKRALACFQAQKIDVTPYSVDRTAGPRKFGFSHLLIPNANTLSSWNLLFHEWIGYFSYYMMGYI